MTLNRPAILGPDVELIPVSDVEEEVFLLYTALSATPSLSIGSALGSVNSRDDHLSVEFELPLVSQRGKRKTKSELEHVSFELAQDVTTLRTRKGDTGSVVWRASVFLARLVLAQQRMTATDQPVLFSQAALTEATVLELGAGTGILAVTIGRLARSYVATDLDFLVPLIRKNLALNDIPSTVSAEVLDWEALRSLSVNKRSKPDNHTLVLAVDTLYNPSLIPAFVTALEHYTQDGACALVICELRSEDVVREFLETWLVSGRWQVFRVGSGLIDLPFVGWVAWRGVQNVDTVLSISEGPEAEF